MVGTTEVKLKGFLDHFLDDEPRARKPGLHTAGRSRHGGRIAKPERDARQLRFVRRPVGVGKLQRDRKPDRIRRFRGCTWFLCIGMPGDPHADTFDQRRGHLGTRGPPSQFALSRHATLQNGGRQPRSGAPTAAKSLELRILGRRGNSGERTLQAVRQDHARAGREAVGSGWKGLLSRRADDNRLVSPAGGVEHRIQRAEPGISGEP